MSWKMHGGGGPASTGPVGGSADGILTPPLSVQERCSRRARDSDCHVVLVVLEGCICTGLMRWYYYSKVAHEY